MTDCIYLYLTPVKTTYTVWCRYSYLVHEQPLIWKARVAIQYFTGYDANNLLRVPVAANGVRSAGFLLAHLLHTKEHLRISRILLTKANSFWHLVFRKLPLFLCTFLCYFKKSFFNVLVLVVRPVNSTNLSNLKKPLARVVEPASKTGSFFNRDGPDFKENDFPSSGFLRKKIFCIFCQIELKVE